MRFKYSLPALAILGVVVGVSDLRSPYRKSVSSAVMIESGDGHGTGVFVGDGRHILTAAHVVHGARIVAHSPVAGGYGPGLACTVVKVDSSIDLALLRVEGRGTPLPLADEPSPGDELILIGCANGPYGFNKGHCRQVYHAEFPTAGGDFSARVLDMSTPVNFGDSGGPVVDSGGRLAGILVLTDAFKSQTAFAVSPGVIRAFLEGTCN